MAKIKLTQKDTIAMFRNAFYSAMAVRNGELKPTDSEMLIWLAKVQRHASNLSFPGYLPAEGFPHWTEIVRETRRTRNER